MIDPKILATEVMGWTYDESTMRYLTNVGTVTSSALYYNPATDAKQALDLLNHIRSTGGAFEISSCDGGVKVLVSLHGTIGKGVSSVDIPYAICAAIGNALNRSDYAKSGSEDGHL